MKKHIVKEVEPGSIAREMGIEAGDALLSINGQKIADVLDYRFMLQEEELLLEIEKPDNEIWELDIEKDEQEDIGLVFESGLMDQPKECQNRCVFCFIDQLPKGMRKSLYFKDDDPRLSFLTGNYVSLSNLSQEEAERIAGYHLSPLHISVHAADPALRRKMLNNPKSDNLFEHLRRFNKAGITMHFQIVLCKGINDGAALDDTIKALSALATRAGSLSVVPVGLTKYRDGLHPLEPFSKEEAKKVISQVEKYKNFAYCSDEWYIKAGVPIPPYEYYGDFPQLENGVGMWALFEREFRQVLTEYTGEGTIGIVTGEGAEALMVQLAKLTSQDIKIYPVRNNFFGHHVTTSGLLTGGDIVAQVKEKARQDGCKGVFLPGNMFRDGTECTLDDMQREEIEESFGIPVWIGSNNGSEFAGQIEGTYRRSALND